MQQANRGAAAVLAFVCFYALGRFVTAHGEPAALQSWEKSLLNHSTLVAWWLTCACYVQVLLPLCIALLVVAWRVPAWRTRAIMSVVLVLVCWRGADLMQHVFARTRPTEWFVKHETTYGYPSSHAAIVAGFYWLWAAMLYYSNPRCLARQICSALLLVLGVGICWSRLALGAHYVTDIIGGILFAAGVVLAAAAVLPGLFARDAGRAPAPVER